MDGPRSGHGRGRRSSYAARARAHSVLSANQSTTPSTASPTRRRGHGRPLPRTSHPIPSHPVSSLPLLPFFLTPVLYLPPQHRVHAEDQHDSAYARRMKRWASEEGATGRGGSGRGGGRSTGTGVGAGAGAAVTGHRPRAANNNKKSSASSSSSSTTAANSKARQAAPAAAAPGLRKTASVLSAVADRRGRFGT